LEFQRVIRATLELPPATEAELEMLDILTRGGEYQLDSLCVSPVLACWSEGMAVSFVSILIVACTAAASLTRRGV
jgi:hypothetical protein